MDYTELEHGLGRLRGLHRLSYLRQ